MSVGTQNAAGFLRVFDYNFKMYLLSTMDLLWNQSPIFRAIIIAIITGGSITILSILPVRLIGIYLYLGDIWTTMIKKSKELSGMEYTAKRM
jgi:hypothetical protein